MNDRPLFPLSWRNLLPVIVKMVKTVSSLAKNVVKVVKVKMVIFIFGFGHLLTII